MSEKNKNNDLKIIAFGFVAIVFISSLFLLKGRYSKNHKVVSEKISDQSDSPHLAQNFASLSSSELDAKITSREKVTIFDLRSSDDFGMEHILDSKNLPSDYLERAVLNKDASLDPDKEYVFVDILGLTPDELRVMQAFNSAGFKRISYLEGGISEWKNESKPTVTFGNPYSLADQSKVTYLKSDDLKKELSVEKIFLIDVRSAAEFQVAHIPGAINIPLDDLELRRRDIPSRNKVVLYDNNGVSAFQGGVRLFDAGTVGVYVLSDGFNVWKQKNYPVVIGQ